MVKSKLRFCSTSSDDNGARVSCSVAIEPNFEMRTWSKRSRMRSGPRWISTGTVSSSSTQRSMVAMSDHGAMTKTDSGESARAESIARLRSTSSTCRRSAAVASAGSGVRRAVPTVCSPRSHGW